SPPAGDPWAPPGPRPTDGFAIASLVTGIVGLGVVPLALGVVALQRTARSGAAGRGMAVAGIVLGAVGILAGLVLVAAFAVGAVTGLTALAREASSPGTSSAGSAAVGIDDLVAGDCFDYPGPDDPEDAVLGVDCGDEHDAEVVDVLPLPGTTYPGDDGVDAAADARCSAAVGQALDAAGVDTATLDYDYFAPLRETWDAGLHDVQCLVTAVGDGTLTGSLGEGTLEAPALPGPTV
ncbi:DUF4190 domain-containing protein, partial [Kineococcus sp. R8]|uniref:DUF4190 domain-containing protein n=1 Tax=Kineococcus siccus TaxID=2696567 RepID=UPI001413020C